MSASKTTIGENETYVLECSPLDETTGAPATGLTVTYIIYDSSTGSTITSGTLAEVGSTGLYKGSYVFSTKGNYRVKYSSTDYPDGYESIFVTDVNTNVDLIKKIESNRWKIDTSAYTFTIYDDDDTTELLVFDLKNAAGSIEYSRGIHNEPYYYKRIWYR